MKGMNNLRRQITLMMMVVCMSVFLCSAAVAFFSMKNALMTDAEKQINNLLEVATTILSGYEKRVQSGELTLAEAQKAAIENFKSLRYEGKNYFWIMDKNCIYIYHPLRNAGFNGKELKDVNGQYYIADLGAKAVEGKADFTKSFSVKPGDPKKKKYPKIMKGQLFPDWGWVVSTGIYMDEVNNVAFKAFVQLFISNFIAALLILILVNVIFISRIIKKITNLSDELASTATNVYNASQDFQVESQKLAEGSAEQASSLQEIAATIEETASMVQRNDENSKYAADLAKQTQENTTQSYAKMNMLMDAMTKINASSQEISKIIKVIDEIAFQTNILALNAAVEAARAGDAGKGFAVVAEEVRNLAQRSTQSAKDTTVLIESNVTLYEESDNLAKTVHTAISGIDTDISKVSELVQEVAVATHEQQIGIDQIHSAITQLEQVLQNNVNSAEHTNSYSRQLSFEVSSLNEVVANLSSMVRNSDD